jgi:cytidine deaminase
MPRHDDDTIASPGRAGARSTPGGSAESIDEPTTLEDHARAVQSRAYAPYSKFRVGAAVQMNGQIFDGVNVENASYPLSVCAERNAIAAGVAAGARDHEAVVVITDASPPSAPCGGCRQVLSEFAADPTKVTVTAINNKGERRSWTIAHLLPDSFSGRELPKNP